MGKSVEEIREIVPLVINAISSTIVVMKSLIFFPFGCFVFLGKPKIKPFKHE